MAAIQNNDAINADKKPDKIKGSIINFIKKTTLSLNGTGSTP